MGARIRVSQMASGGVGWGEAFLLIPEGYTSLFQVEEAREDRWSRTV